LHSRGPVIPETVVARRDERRLLVVRRERLLRAICRRWAEDGHRAGDRLLSGDGRALGSEKAEKGRRVHVLCGSPQAPMQFKGVMVMNNEERIRRVSSDGSEEPVSEERRDFLKKCGRFAAYAAPAMILLLSHKTDAGAATSPV